MRVVALVPFWEKYETNEFRLKKLSGKYLLSYSLETLNLIDKIDEIFVYSSSESVLKYIEPDIEFTLLKRPKYLDDVNVSIEEIISKFIESISADVIVMLHPTSPLLSENSVQKALHQVIEDKSDSSFSAEKYKQFAWFKSQPINYDLEKDIPSLDDVSPIFIERSSLYVFNVNSFLKNRHRLSGRIDITEIDRLEGLEVRSKSDFELLELIINSGLHGEL